MKSHNYAHLRWNRSTAEKPFKCGVCSRSFTAKTSLYDHVKRNHDQDDSIFSCIICDLKFPSQQAIDKHLKSHAQLQVKLEGDVDSSSDSKEEDDGSRFDDEDDESKIEDEHFFRPMSQPHISLSFCRLMAFVERWGSKHPAFRKKVFDALDMSNKKSIYQYSWRPQCI